MIDIVSASAAGLSVYDTQVSKAANVLSVQLGALEYAPDFGIDIRFFMDPDFIFQNESFKSYLIQRLSESNVNVSSVAELLEALYLKYTFVVGDRDRSTGGFIK